MYNNNNNYHGTTVLSVRKNGKVVVIGDGQVTMGDTIVKPNAKKVRRLKGDILAGFAGATADALTLMELLEVKLEEHPGLFQPFLFLFSCFFFSIEIEIERKF